MISPDYSLKLHLSTLVRVHCVKGQVLLRENSCLGTLMVQRDKPFTLTLIKYYVFRALTAHISMCRSEKYRVRYYTDCVKGLTKFFRPRYIFPHTLKFTYAE